jgi:hypothetical protein
LKLIAQFLNTGFIPSAADYLRSMERLLTLPVRVVHGGHFPSFGAERHHQLIRRWLDDKQENA